MDVLQLSVHALGDGLGVSVTGDGVRHDGTASLPGFGPAEAATLRWLLEDLPRLSSESAGTAGVLGEAHLPQLGQRLFEAVKPPFEAAAAGRPRDALALVIDDPQGLARHLPWELLLDGDRPLAQDLGALVRAAKAPARPPQPRPPGPLRLLLVVARPAGRDDVAFRSVASRVLAATQAAGSPIEARVLRPGTFVALRAELRAAWKAGRPYDIVHFDGHGAQHAADDGRLRTVIVFEPDELHPDGLFDAGRLALVLGGTAVRLFVLNACHAAAALPAAANADDGDGDAIATRAAMSFAEQVASSAGIDVVAMSHAIHVATAALVVQDLYAALAHGAGIAGAVGFARRRWRDGIVQRSPSLGFVMLRHFGRADDGAQPATWPAHVAPSALGDRTPAAAALPAVFHAEAPLVAPDEALLLLERALAEAPLVQFIGLRGSGKTTLLLELGRWLAVSDHTPPSQVLHLDLAGFGSPAEVFDVLAAAQPRLLLIDEGQRIEGDPLRGLPPWPPAEALHWLAVTEALIGEGARIVVASTAPLGLHDKAPCVLVPDMTAADLRQLASLQAGAGAMELPEAALRWACGHPGVLALLLERERARGFVDPATTLQTLSGLGFGKLPPGADTMMELVRPLLLGDPRSLYGTKASALLPWLLMQFRGTMLLSSLVWQMAESLGLKGLAAAANAGEVDVELERLQRAGLACRIDERRLRLHPMLPYVLPQPLNREGLGEPGHWTLLRYAAALYVRMLQVLGSGSPLLGRDEAAHGPGDLADLLHGFDWTTDGGAVDHTVALSLARRLRNGLLELQPDLWPPVFDKLCAAFARSPPPPDDGVFNPNNVFRLLRMEEAQRRGDTAAAEALAAEAEAAAAAVPGATIEPVDGRPGPDMSQVNRYDTLIKTGRGLAEKDPPAARAAFEAALQAAGSDDLRRARVQLELTRLLRRTGVRADLEAARDHGEEALATFVRFAKAKLADRSDVSQSAMSLSIVYRDLAHAAKPPDPALAARGEALCQASLDQASSDGERATAQINLGFWRRDAGDPAAAAGHFLEAANLYEQLGLPLLLGRALAYRAECLLASGDALQARIDGVRATNLLVELPDKSRDLILFAYQTAERAMAQMKAEGYVDDAGGESSR